MPNVKICSHKQKPRKMCEIQYSVFRMRGRVFFLYRQRDLYFTFLHTFYIIRGEKIYADSKNPPKSIEMYNNVVDDAK